MQIDKTQYLNKFKIIQNQTLFEPDYSLAWKQNVCPLCFNRLRLLPTKGIKICSGKKHKKPFICKSFQE